MRTLHWTQISFTSCMLSSSSVVWQCVSKHFDYPDPVVIRGSLWSVTWLSPSRSILLAHWDSWVTAILYIFFGVKGKYCRMNAHLLQFYAFFHGHFCVLNIKQNPPPPPHHQLPQPLKKNLRGIKASVRSHTDTEPLSRARI